MRYIGPGEPQLPLTYRVVLESRTDWAAMSRWLNTSTAREVDREWAAPVVQPEGSDHATRIEAWFQFPNFFRQEIRSRGELRSVSGSDGKRMWWHNPGRFSPPTQRAPGVLLRAYDPNGKSHYTDITDEVGAGTEIFDFVLNEMLDARVLWEDFQAERLTLKTFLGREVVVADGYLEVVRSDGTTVWDSYVPGDRHVAVTDIETGVILEAISYGAGEVLCRHAIIEFDLNWTADPALFVLPPELKDSGHQHIDNSSIHIPGT